MAEYSITITIRYAWWVKPYLCALQFFGDFTGLEPDTEKAADLIARHGVTVGVSPIAKAIAARDVRIPTT